MIYSGSFADIQNKVYRVTITTNSGNQTKTVTLGGSPFVTEMDSDDKTIYSPAKYQTATVSIITPDYNFDIYSPKAQGTKVVLTDESGATVWTGYTTPNLYDMGFVEEREEIEIECIDALSTLQYIKYSTDRKQVVSFLYLIRKLLRSCNAYSHFFVSNNIQLKKGAAETVLDKLYIAEENFFDKKEDKETDEDVAWTMQEVLEEICQYLGLTAVADGDKVYFIDYDAIKHGINTYYKYSVDDDSAPTLETIRFSKTIKAEDYSESGATLSLDNVYNKVSVKADLYTYDNLIPDLFSNLINITKDYDEKIAVPQQTGFDSGMYGTFIKSKIGGDKSDNTNTIGVVVKPMEVTDPDMVLVKYYDSPSYKFFKYDSNGREITDSVKGLNYTDTMFMCGATAAKFFVQRGKDYYVGNNNDEIFDNLLKYNDINKIEFTNYIMFINPTGSTNPVSNHIPNSAITQYPFFETTMNDTALVFGGENSYLVISGSIMFHEFNYYPYPVSKYWLGNSGTMAAGEGYLLCKLKWNNLYWNGSQWTEAASTFKLKYIKDNAPEDDRNADNCFFKFHPIVNNVSWKIGSKESGQMIPLPKNRLVGGVPVLTVYKPYDPNFGNENLKPCCMFIKDFAMKAVVADPSFGDNNDSDTLYTNIINDTFVTELADIKFKIATWDNKKPNYSAVAYKQGSAYQYLDKTFNRACNAGEAAWVGSDNEEAASGLRQEEHLIYKLVNQYSSPSVILNLSLRNDNKIFGLYKDATIADRDFIVDCVNIDFKQNKQVIKLIEKK